MGISNDDDVEICLASSGNYQKWLSIDMLKNLFSRKFYWPTIKKKVKIKKKKKENNLITKNKTQLQSFFCTSRA